MPREHFTSSGIIQCPKTRSSTCSLWWSYYWGGQWYSEPNLLFWLMHLQDMAKLQLGATCCNRCSNSSGILQVTSDDQEFQDAFTRRLLMNSQSSKMIPVHHASWVQCIPESLIRRMSCHATYNLSNLYSNAQIKLTCPPRSPSTHDNVPCAKWMAVKWMRLIKVLPLQASSWIYCITCHSQPLAFWSLLCRMLCKNCGRISWTGNSFEIISSRSIISSIWPPWHELDTQYNKKKLGRCSSWFLAHA